jgi:hypothetical protein
VEKVVYRRENSSAQAKVGHDELAKIRSRIAGLTSLCGPAGPEPDCQTSSSSDSRAKKRTVADLGFGKERVLQRWVILTKKHVF